ncbi:50S ribosomal protein L14e [Candidatus Woesearchaeota archaeon]|nr:50S ribosomal protein L14e [Candidatus Woesearchaeota archaeon]
MIEIGRLCVKLAGRDAGLKCVVVDILDDKFVLIDGETRRRKCNILHIEPLKDVLKIKKKASHEEIKKEFEKLGLKIRETKPKQKTERPRKKRKTPERLRQQKEEKKKLRDVFRRKGEKSEKKTAEKEAGKEETLEERAGLDGGREEKEPKKSEKQGR